MKNFKQIVILTLITISVVFSTTSYASDYIDDAQQYFDKGEYEAAIIQLKNYLKENPDDAHARYLLGQSYNKSGNISGAFKEFEKAYKINKNDVQIQLAYASLLRFKNENQKVKEILKKSYEDKSQESQRMVILADIALSENKLADAKELLEMAKLSDNTIEVQLTFVQLAMLEKNNSTAEEIIESVLQRDSNNPKALLLKAISLSSKQKYKESLEILYKLHEQYPNNLRYRLEIAGIKYKLKDFEDVEHELADVLKKNKNLPQANSLMSLSKLNQKQYKEAIEYAQNVLNVLPEHYLSMFVVGVSELALGNLNQAEKYLNQVLFQFPDNVEVKRMLANLYIAKKEGEQALLLLESIDKDKVAQSANLSLSLGTAYLLTGDYQKAVEALHNAKKLEPDNKLIKERLVTGYFKANDLKNAIASLENIASDKNNKQAQYLLIITYIQNKEYEKARKTIETLKIQSPDDSNLYNLQAALYLINKNKSLALSTYQKAIEINKNYIPAYLGIVRIYMAEKQYKQADELFKKILKINNKYIKAWLGRASIAEITGNTDKVEYFIKEGLKKSEGDFKSERIALEQLAKWYVKQDQKEKVLELSDEFVKRYPGQEGAQYFQVKALFLNGKRRKAEAVLEKLLFNEPGNRRYQLLLITLLVENKDYSRALELLDNVLESQPDDKKALILKAKLLVQNEQFKEALEVSKHLQTTFPEDIEGYKLEADILLSEKKYDDALVKYQKIFGKKPSNQVLLKIVDIFLQQNHPDHAIKILKNALINNTSNQVARYRLALLLQQQKNYNSAAKQYQIIIKNNPDNVLALNNLAWILAEQGHKDALGYAKKAYQLKPDSPAILDTYGYILLKENQAEQSVKILQRAAELAPKSYDIQYHLAKAYYLTGNHNKAKEILTEISGDVVNFSEKENAKILFKRLQ